MKVTFLGTGTSQGVPVIGCTCPACQSADPRDQRLRSSVMVECGENRLVIDTGPDFRQQMLREKVTSVSAILITHGHKDHVGGLDDVRAFNYFMKRPADVYASREARSVIRREFNYAFSDKRYPGVPEISLHPVCNRPFNIMGMSIMPVRALHYGTDKFVFGYRIGDFSYLTDAVHISEKEKRKLMGSKILVLNALRKKKHYSHFCLSEAVELMEELKPERGYLTHISHQMGPTRDLIPLLPSFVQPAWDGLSITF